MVSKSITATTVGINAHKIEVEVDVINSLPNISIVGLPDSAVNEAKERVHSAIKNSGFSFPPGRVIVNLAPADIRKEGTNFDLPSAVGILKEQGVNIPDDLTMAFLGCKSNRTAPPPKKGSTYVEPDFTLIIGKISDNNCLFPPTHFKIGLTKSFFAIQTFLFF